MIFSAPESGRGLISNGSDTPHLSVASTSFETRDRVRVNPLLILVVPFVLSFLVELEVPFPVAMPWPVRLAGLGFLAGGMVLGGPAFRLFLRARTTLNPQRSPTSLVTQGRYQYTRNPMYLGQFLMYIGVAVLLGTVWALIALPFVIVAVDRWVVRKEEAILTRTFGTAYVRYASEVRRWIGRKNPP